jgi:hypothetical protein
MAEPQDIERLRTVIRHMHGCDATHVETVTVHETFRGETVWAGEVEVFAVEQPNAKCCYAWSYRDTDGSERFAALLGRNPIHTPLDAVKAFLVAEASRKFREP